MIQDIKYTKECLIYPGGYTPIPEAEAVIAEQKSGKEDAMAKPSANMEELKDCFKIEVLIPGVKRENIFIQAHDHILSITVAGKDSDGSKKKLQIHEFNANYPERLIRMPATADTEFVNAEYHQGVLSLYIAKAGKSEKVATSEIVVY